MQIKHGRSRFACFFESLSWELLIDPGLTTTERDQWEFWLIGIKMNFFSKMLISFLVVQFVIEPNFLVLS
jgi:hypothetical protein